MNNFNRNIVRDYLGSLKEDKELDAIFPLLLSTMGFRIIATAEDSKGMPQYGKDIIAVKDNRKYYFELKGYSDRDITSSSFNKNDGIRESIYEAIDTPFVNGSFGGFSDMNTSIIIVHNGEVKRNFKPQFEGFIDEMMKKNPGIEITNWDIHHLTDLFTDYLFNEYLLSDSESIRLFKRVLVLLDLGEGYYEHFEKLIYHQIDKFSSTDGRKLKKFLATQLLLANIIFSYSRENNNLETGKKCISFQVLQLWSWVLKKNLQRKEAILNSFEILYQLFNSVLNEYFSKSLDLAKEKRGLFLGRTGQFEKLGYSLRLISYVNHLCIYFRNNLSNSIGDPKDYCEILNEIIDNNEDGLILLKDNQSIFLVNVATFFIENKSTEYALNFLKIIIENLLFIKANYSVLPEYSNNEDNLIDLLVNHYRPENYCDSSTCLLYILLEFSVLLKREDYYQIIKEKLLDKDTNLQLFTPYISEYPNFEITLFEKEIKEGLMITNIQIEDDFSDFSNKVLTESIESLEYKTPFERFRSLKILAHVYYDTPFFQEDWLLKL